MYSYQHFDIIIIISAFFYSIYKRIDTHTRTDIQCTKRWYYQIWSTWIVQWCEVVYCLASIDIFRYNQFFVYFSIQNDIITPFLSRLSRKTFLIDYNHTQKVTHLICCVLALSNSETLFWVSRFVFWFIIIHDTILLMQHMQRRVVDFTWKLFPIFGLIKTVGPLTHIKNGSSNHRN